MGWHRWSHGLLIRYPERQYQRCPVIPVDTNPDKLLVVELSSCLKSDCGRERPLRAEDWVWRKVGIPGQLKAFVDIGYDVICVDCIPQLRDSSLNPADEEDIGIIIRRVERVIAELAFDPLVILGPAPHLMTAIRKVRRGRIGLKSCYCGRQGLVELPWIPPTTLYVSTVFQLPLRHGPEVLIMVGPPGAGKTKFIETHLQPKGYLPVDSELWGLPDLLQLGFSVVIDGCHP